MSVERLQIILPIVALMSYLFIRLTLSFLATHTANHLRLHDLVRESKQLRREYLESIEHYDQD